MNKYTPRWQVWVAALGTFGVMVLPCIAVACKGYLWGVEHGLKIDTSARPESLGERLMVLGLGLPMIPVLMLAVLVAGIPWMFMMSRILPWADIEYFTGRKGPRIPLLSDWLERMWLRMIEDRRRRAGNAQPPGNTGEPRAPYDNNPED